MNNHKDIYIPISIYMYLHLKTYSLLSLRYKSILICIVFQFEFFCTSVFAGWSLYLFFSTTVSLFLPPRRILVLLYRRDFSHPRFLRHLNVVRRDFLAARCWGRRALSLSLPFSIYKYKYIYVVYCHELPTLATYKKATGLLQDTRPSWRVRASDPAVRRYVSYLIIGPWLQSVYGRMYGHTIYILYICMIYIYFSVYFSSLVHVWRVCCS